MKIFTKCPWCNRAISFKFYSHIKISLDIEFDENQEPILPKKNIDRITGKDFINANGDDPFEEQELWCTYCGASWDAYTYRENKNNEIKAGIKDLPRYNLP